ncbi:hypothetical protein C8F01DRAFT_1049201 [Mycena amicta]|nr:hypothetical protein C8F01DRAFT_1049201 [Mycena amicta]
MNPFAQGWNHASHTSSPPLYGVLPGQQQYTPVAAAPPAPAPELVRFTFVPSGPDGTIHTSVVTSPGQAAPCFRITTNSTVHGYSVVQNDKNENIAYVEWLARATPMVDIYGVVSKRSTAEWLPLSSRKSYRRMSARQQTFRWVPSENNINLYSDSSSNPQFFGRLLRTQRGTAVELTLEALQLGLLDIVVVAALVLLSGRNID